MADFRKVIIVFIIAVLFAVFVFSLNAAVNESPKYEKYCRDEYSPKTIPATDPYGKANCSALLEKTSLKADCDAREGTVQARYDSNGCATSWECSTCQHDYDLAEQRHDWWMFLIAAAFGLAAIIAGIWLPVEKGSLGETISIGFLLGGLVTLLIGTAFSYTTIYKWLRPIIILFELILVIFIAYKKFKVIEKKNKR